MVERNLATVLEAAAGIGVGPVYRPFPSRSDDGDGVRYGAKP